MISFWSVFSAFLWFVLVSLLLYALRRRENFLMRYGVVAWSVAVILSVVRLLVPLDDAHMIILRSYSVLPALNRVLKYELLKGITVEQLLLMIWLVGSLFGLLLILYGILRDRRRLQQLPMAPLTPKMRETIQAYRSNKVTVCITPATVTPMAVGLLRPTICLPDREYSETELRWILQHEMTHISSHDAWLRLGYLLFRCLFWWNPFVHWGQRSVDDILELRCDKTVLEKADPSERREYAEVLYHVAKEIHQDSPAFIGAGTFVQTSKTGILVLRAKRALDEPHLYQGATLTAIVLSVVFFAASYAFILQPASFPPSDMEDGDEIFQISPESSYIQKTPSGDYELWCNGEYAGPISDKALKVEPYNTLEVRP